LRSRTVPEDKKILNMKIEKDKIKYTANLARISLTSEEEVLFSEQLNNILSYMEKIGKIDTADVKPTSHAVSMGNVFRDDIPKKSLLTKEVLINVPDKEDSFFRVPRILE